MKRNADAGYFCRIVCQEATTTAKPVWIIADARRPSDIKYFQVELKFLIYLKYFYVI